MVKIVVLYGHPTDPAAFEEYYAGHHLPLVGGVPGIARFEAGRMAPSPDGSPPAYYRIAELWFDSLEALQASSASPESEATVADIANFATGGATVMVAEVD